MKKIILTALATIIVALPLHAEKMRIAVINFKGTGVSQRTASNVSELIRGEMINSGLYQVIERAQMDTILKEQGLQQTGCTDVTCAVQLGKILSAKKILIGTVMELGGNIVISARVVDVETGTGEFSEKETAQSEKYLVDAVTIFTQKLTDRISGQETYQEEVEEEAVEEPVKDDRIFVYDPWYFGIEAHLGNIFYVTGSGESYLAALSFNNSYKKKIHFGLRFGGVGMDGPGATHDDYGEYDYDYDMNKVYIDDGSFAFGEIQLGFNFRGSRDWFGISLYAGVGLFRGELDTISFAQYDEDIEDIDGYYTVTENITYTAPLYTLTLEMPFSSWGARFFSPMAQLIIIPTPKQVDQKYLIMLNFIAFKLAW